MIAKVLPFPVRLPARGAPEDLTPSDGQETVMCATCFATILDGGAVVVFDVCEACEDAEKRRRPERT